jgi:hypothetical protein
MLDGKKTFIGIALFVLGYLGVAQFVGGTEELTKIADSVVVLAGVAIAIYGRIKSVK